MALQITSSQHVFPFVNEPDHVNDTVVLAGWGDYKTNGNCTLIKILNYDRNSMRNVGFAATGGVPSPVLRTITTTVISSAGTNGTCQQTAGIGSFSGDRVICTDGSQGRRLCNVSNSMTSKIFTIINLNFKNV